MCLLGYTPLGQCSLVCVPLSLAYQHIISSSDASLPMPKVVLLQAVFFAIGVASFPPHSLIGIVPCVRVPACGCKMLTLLGYRLRSDETADRRTDCGLLSAGLTSRELVPVNMRSTAVG